MYHSEKLSVKNTARTEVPKYTPWVRSKTVPPQDRYTKFKSNLALAVRQYMDFSTVLFYNGSWLKAGEGDPLKVPYHTRPFFMNHVAKTYSNTRTRASSH